MTQAANNIFNGLNEILTGNVSVISPAPDTDAFTKELADKIDNEKYIKSLNAEFYNTDKISDNSEIGYEKSKSEDSIGKEDDDNDKKSPNKAANCPDELLAILQEQFIVPQLKPASDNASALEDGINLLSENNAEEQALVAEKIAEAVVEEVSGSADDNFAQADFGLDEEMLQDLNIETVKADVNSNSGDGFQQQQSAEEYGIKVMLQHSVESSNINFDNIQAQTSQIKSVDYSAERILEQINRQIQGLQSGSKVNIVLNPESLGKVNLQLINTKEGLSAQFTVTTQEAREIIMKGLDGLKSSLLSHGINVENITVKVAETEQEDYSQDWTEQEGSRGGNKEEGRFGREEKEKGLFEKTIAKTIEEQDKV